MKATYFDDFPNQEFIAYIRERTKAIIMEEFTRLNGFVPEEPPVSIIDRVMIENLDNKHRSEKAYFRSIRLLVRAGLAFDNN